MCTHTVCTTRHGTLARFPPRLSLWAMSDKPDVGDKPDVSAIPTPRADRPKPRFGKGKGCAPATPPAPLSSPASEPVIVLDSSTVKAKVAAPKAAKHPTAPKAASVSVSAVPASVPPPNPGGMLFYMCDVTKGGGSTAVRCREGAHDTKQPRCHCFLRVSCHSSSTCARLAHNFV